MHGLLSEQPPWESSNDGAPSPSRRLEHRGGTRAPSPQVLRPWSIRTRDDADDDDDDLPPWLSHRPHPPQLSPRSPEIIDWLDEQPEAAEEQRRKCQPSSPAAVCNVCEEIYRGAVCKCAQLWVAHPIAKILSRARSGSGPMAVGSPPKLVAMGQSPSRRLPVADCGCLAIGSAASSACSGAAAAFLDRPTGCVSSRASTSRASTSRSRASTGRSARWNDEQLEEDHIFRV